MIAATFKRLAEKDRESYSVTWLVAFGIAIVIAPFVMQYRTASPWIVCGAIGIASFGFFLLELRSCGLFERRSADTLVKMSDQFQLLAHYEDMLTLAVQPKAKLPRGQLAFPNFPEATPQGSIRMLIDERSTSVPAINCEKYSALLVSYVLEHLDKATEKSLAAGMERFSMMHGGRNELQKYFHDKAVREAIKADFRGNLVSLIAKGGDKVVKDLIKEVESAKQRQAQDLERKEKFFIAGKSKAPSPLSSSAAP
jgi:hypothetical protein